MILFQNISNHLGNRLLQALFFLHPLRFSTQARLAFVQETFWENFHENVCIRFDNIDRPEDPWATLETAWLCQTPNRFQTTIACPEQILCLVFFKFFFLTERYKKLISFFWVILRDWRKKSGRVAPVLLSIENYFLSWLVPLFRSFSFYWIMYNNAVFSIYMRVANCFARSSRHSTLLIDIYGIVRKL